MSDLKKIVGQRLREYRNAKGYSIEELAHIADMNAVHLASLERREKNITLSTLEKVSKALDVPLANVFAVEHSVPSSEHPIAEKAASLMKKMTEEEQEFIIQTIQFIRKNNNDPPAKPVVFLVRAKPYCTSGVSKRMRSVTCMLLPVVTLERVSVFFHRHLIFNLIFFQLICNIFCNLLGVFASRVNIVSPALEAPITILIFVIPVSFMQN